VVQHSAVEGIGCRSEPAGRAAVAIARARVAARVIVRKHDPGTTVRDCIGDDLPQWKRRAAFIPVVPRQVQAIRFFINVRHPELLAVGISFGKAAGEERARGCKPVKLQRRFGTLISHCR